MTDRREPATPTSVRAVTSYPARRTYAPGAVFAPAVPGVAGAIDIHCHAHEGQQDAFSVAKLASTNRMKGLLYKTISSPLGFRPEGTMSAIRELEANLEKWSEHEGIEPTRCWGGWGVARGGAPDIRDLKAALSLGIKAIWLPVANHANTLFKVGGKPIWWDKTADPKDHTPPLPWETALEIGQYMLDDKGHLKPIFEDSIRMVADADVALFFGHATHPEIWAVAELLDKLRFKRGVVDHPFSPFVDLSVEQMKQLAASGIYLNFTYDEISPLLGVDPAVMYDAIREIGVSQCTLSSDAGEPLFPNSVECIRLLSGTMEAFGLDKDEIDVVCRRNPEFIVGL